jgi:hypothetical protein
VSWGQLKPGPGGCRKERRGEERREEEVAKGRYI